MADEIAGQGQQADNQALIGYVEAHAAGKDAGFGVARLAPHDVCLGALHAESEGREAVGDEVYPEQVDRLQYGEAEQRSHEDADDLAHVGAEQELDSLTDVVVDTAAFLDGADDGGEVVVRENHVSDVLGDVGTGDTHADADVGALNAGRVVDAVAGHGGDVAVAAPGIDYTGLVLGLYTGVNGDVLELLVELLIAHLVELAASDGAGLRSEDAELAGDGHGGVNMVAGDHDGTDTGAAALLYSGLDLGTYRIDHAGEADEGEVMLEVGGAAIGGDVVPETLAGGEDTQGLVGHSLVGGEDLVALGVGHGLDGAVLEVIGAELEHFVRRALGVLDNALVGLVDRAHHLTHGVKGSLAHARLRGLEGGFTQAEAVGVVDQGAFGRLTDGDEGRNIPGCVKNGIPEATANAIYDEILDFASYAFNKAHAVAYAIVAYRTAYMKRHYPREYMAALLTSVLDSSSKVAEYIAECREMRINLLPPDVNESDAYFTISGKNIRFGLVAIKNIGEKFILQLMDERRENGPFKSLEDFCRRMSGKELNRRAIESLIRSGAFDGLGATRKSMMAVLDNVLEGIASDGRRNIEGQMDLFGGEEPALTSIAMPQMEEYSRAELMAMERETTGLYLTGHPMDEYREAARSAGAVSIGAILSDFANEAGPERFADEQYVTIAGIVASKRTRTTKNGTLMAYIQLEDDTGTIELLAFQRALDNGGGYVADNAAIIVRGRISVRDEKEPQIVVDSIRPMSDAALPDGSYAKPRKLWIRLAQNDARIMRRIELLQEMFPGNDRMIVYFADTGRRFGADCVIMDSLVRELVEMVGAENVKVV